jgi:hypothetical protein
MLRGKRVRADEDRFVFTHYENMSGWESKGITFLTGLLGVNWGFSCLGNYHCAQTMDRS